MLRPSDEILFLTGTIIGLSAIFTILLPLILKAFLVVLVVETGVLASFSIKAIEDEEKTQIAVVYSKLTRKLERRMTA
jgi:hypothetical protein